MKSSRFIDTYILVGKKPHKQRHLGCWAAWMKENDRVLLRSPLRTCQVVTTFLGIDHNYNHTAGPDPILFETLVLKNEFDPEGTLPKPKRYSTWLAAKKGHIETVEYYRGFGA